MYSEKLEELINHALADGVLTEKEKQILFKNAEAEGIDLDEFEMVLDARLYEKQQGSKEEDKSAIDEIKSSPEKQIVLANDFINPIETIIRENLTVNDDLYFHENLPKKKLSNAMNSYIFLDDDEQIICFYDSTVFGSASDGVCLSTKGIYWKNLWEDSDYLCYCDIESIKKGKDCLH
ncbi:MAG: hypothetical protein LBR97_02095, partial [Dysgonamonadaceae bacterium]|nr:hypothetical protein [Dysgonamonadaceae bacterium]